jgi:hypothetical protein
MIHARRTAGEQPESFRVVEERGIELDAGGDVGVGDQTPLLPRRPREFDLVIREAVTKEFAVVLTRDPVWLGPQDDDRRSFRHETRPLPIGLVFAPSGSQALRRSHPKQLLEVVVSGSIADAHVDSRLVST